MYFIKYDDPADYRWQPWDAVAFTANCTARVALLASTQIEGNMTKPVFDHLAPNSTPVLYPLDHPLFDEWILKYWRDQKKRVLTLDLPVGQLFRSEIRSRLSDLITAVVEKEDRLVLFSTESDGLTFARKRIKPTPFESIILLGMRPSSNGFFNDKPLNRYDFVPIFSSTCGEEIYDFRKALSTINMQEINALFDVHSFSDASTGGLIANALYAIMLNGGFTGRAIPEIKELLRFLVEEKGANVNYRLAEGNGSILHLLGVTFANHTNTAVLVQLLKRFGADLTLKNEKGDNPFQTARNHLQYNKIVIETLKTDSVPQPNGEERYERFPYDF